MPITADEVARAIGAGVREAFTTCRFFLGIERSGIENPDIHPEYVTTVKVAEHLALANRVVSLETHMKTIRDHIAGLGRMRRRQNGQDPSEVDDILRPFVFGRKDSQRIDILVQSDDTSLPPLVMVEAKLGISNLEGVCADIDRVTRLLTMINDVGLLQGAAVYGAVVFHLREEVKPEKTLSERPAAFLGGIEAYLATVKPAMPWLCSKTGFLSEMVVEPMSSYDEDYDDGSSEQVFAKHSLAFAPGLILLGAKADVLSVRF